MITDGEDHDEKAKKVAKRISRNGVVINTIGVEFYRGSVIINPFTGNQSVIYEGNVVVSKLNRQELMNIAHNANGIYQQLNDIETVIGKINCGIFRKWNKRLLVMWYFKLQEFFVVLARLSLMGRLFISEKRTTKKYDISLSL